VSIAVAPDGGLTVGTADHAGSGTGPVAFGVRAPLDVALLRWGSLDRDELHPLIHEALFPGRKQVWRAPAPEQRPAIRVRCGPEWHIVQVTGGQIDTPHAEDEIRRELLLGALGGQISGCAGAVRAWRTGVKPMPKEIRKIRRDLFALAFHGDTGAVLAILADGIDPDMRDGHGDTLMHYLHHLDYTLALPLFTAAGLSVDARNKNGGTPLHAAASCTATGAMDALLAAGADPQITDQWGRTADDVLAAIRKGERSRYHYR
jgi:hypothetical protein